MPALLVAGWNSGVGLLNNQVFCEFFPPLLSWISCSTEMNYLAGTEIEHGVGCVTFTELALMLCMLAFGQ